MNTKRRKNKTNYWPPYKAALSHPNKTQKPATSVSNTDIGRESAPIKDKLPKILCPYCRKKGHWGIDCPEGQRDL
jgi:hypothetical protein